MQRDSRQLSRRRLLQLSGLAGTELLLHGCGLSQFSRQVGNVVDPLNQRVGELILNPQRLIPEFSPRQIEPKALLINSFDLTPEIDPAKFKLIIDGAVNRPMELNMAQLQQFPLTFTDHLKSNIGYWENQGYEWFAGL